ncbi:hypothetical protein [Maricaulis sp.]|uniref:hypothetical protein n=1 Tax=Maricaulis sp. TaxID=1486257 RepID=UPI00260A7864|nr:hypothetical protein [Maricaulis sp.]
MSGFSLIGQIHFGLGGLCLLAGVAAFVLRKGARGHIFAGRAFAVSMLLLCASGLYMSFARSIVFTTFLSLFAAHAAATGWLAARESSGLMQRSERLLAGLIALVGIASLATGLGLSVSDLDQLDGLPPEAFYGLGGVALFIAALDALAIIRSPLSRTRRIARHLWRMGFSMFIATFIIFFGNNHVLPEALRTEAILVMPVVLVTLLTVFWLLRVSLLPSWKRR